MRLKWQLSRKSCQIKEGVVMKQLETNDAVITFIGETKAGKYANIDSSIIEVPRNMLSRDEYVFENEEMPVLFSMSN